jgi:hypothetical protein
MLTLVDCIALSELTEDEVQTIARHERIPHIAAAELGNYLVHSADGELSLKEMLRDDIAAAAAHGDAERVLALKLVIRGYIARHPCCESRQHPRPS